LVKEYVMNEGLALSKDILGLNEWILGAEDVMMDRILCVYGGDRKAILLRGLGKIFKFRLFLISAFSRVYPYLVDYSHTNHF
jgi:hypothetical protein